MSRSDPYQARARELCAAAGIEPDSRIGEGRGQPTWCAFRAAARAERVAVEQASVAADMAARTIPAGRAIPEQPAQDLRPA